MENAKMTIQWEGKTIIIEGPTEFVEEQAKIFASSASKPLELRGEQVAQLHSTVSLLIAEKKPKGHHEIVAVLAFHLMQQGILEFSQDDIRRAYVQGRIRPPKVMAQALRDAKNKFDYIESSKKKGSYKLSAHGDRTVRFDLPKTGN